jgi:Domain of unknown function (DUF5667)
MSLSGFDRKKVERFAEFTATATGPRTHRRTSVDDELGPLTQLTRQIRDLTPVAVPTEDFRTALRSFLVATAERDGVGATATAANRDSVAADTAAWQAIKPTSALAGKTQVVRQVSGRTTGRTRLAILTGVTAGAIVLSGVSAASTGALPGDPLYSVKRSTERAQLALAGSDASRGKLYLEFARSRLAEAGQVDPSQAGTVLAEMDSETKQGVALLLASAVTNHDSSAVATVTTFVNQQQQSLSQFQDTLTPELRGRTVGTSLIVLADIQTRASKIDEVIAGTCTLSGQSDEIGPKADPRC